MSDLKTLKQLAMDHGQLFSRTVKTSNGAIVTRYGAPVEGDSPESAAHQFACAINGWNLFESRVGFEVQITDEEYLAAIEAAKNGKAYPPADYRKVHADLLPVPEVADPKKRWARPSKRKSG